MRILITSLLCLHHSWAFLGLTVQRLKGGASPTECMVSSSSEGTVIFDFVEQLSIKSLICKRKTEGKIRKMLIFNANDGSKLSDMLELSTLPTPKLSKKPQRDHAACQASVMTFNKLTRAKNHIKAMTMGEQFAGTEESEMVPQTLRPAEDDPDTEENDEQADDDDDWMSLRKMEVEELFKRKISS